MVALGLATLLAAAAALPARGDPQVSRLLGVAPRDARLVLFCTDSEAMRRRLRRVPAIAAFSRLASDDLKAAVVETLGEAALLLNSDTVDEGLRLLAGGGGGFAVVVEGLAIEEGELVPEVLLVLDHPGGEERVRALVDLAEGRAGALDRVAKSGFPLVLESPPGLLDDGAVPVVSVETTGGRLVLAAAHDRVLIAHTPDPVRRAIERMADSTRGSLLDDRAFAHAVDSVSPRPGDVLWYANLRLLRRDRSLGAVGRAPASLMRGPLLGAARVALAARGVGHALHVRMFVERREWSHAGSGASFHRYAEWVPAPVSAVVSVHASPHEAAELLKDVAGRFAERGYGSSAMEERLLQSFGGERYLSLLAGKLGSELCVFQPEGALPGETLPRLAFGLELLDPEGVSAWFDRLSERGLVRETTVGGVVAWEVRTELPFSPAPVFCVREGRLLGANHSIALRRVLDRMDVAVPLGRDDAVLAPFDLLDRSPEAPGILSGYIDSARIARSATTWLSGPQGLVLYSRLSRETRSNVSELLSLLDDPEVHDALFGAAFYAREVDGGVLFEWIGP